MHGCDFRLSEAASRADIDRICRFRAEVWGATPGVAEQAFPAGSWRDEIDDDAQHWMIHDAQGVLRAAARLHFCSTVADMHEAHEYTRYALALPGPIAAPDRVVVSPQAQGCGLARWLLDAQDAAAQAHGARHALRQASPRMVQLLQHRGWREVGPANIDPRFPGVTFCVMRKVVE